MERTERMTRSKYLPATWFHPSLTLWAELQSDLATLTSHGNVVVAQRSHHRKRKASPSLEPACKSIAERSRYWDQLDPETIAAVKALLDRPASLAGPEFGGFDFEASNCSVKHCAPS
jgi:hypothetical protein